MGLWVSASLQEATPVTLLFLSVLSPSDGPAECPGDPTHGQPAGGHMGPSTPREPEWEHPGLQGKFSCVAGLFFQLTVCPGPRRLWLHTGCMLLCCVPSSIRIARKQALVPGAGLLERAPETKAAQRQATQVTTTKDQGMLGSSKGPPRNLTSSGAFADSNKGGVSSQIRLQIPILSPAHGGTLISIGMG